MGVAGHAEVVEAKERASLVQDSHDAVLAHDCGNRGHADVDFFAIDGDGQLSVLGAAALHDVHVRHDLYSTDQPGPDCNWQLKDLLQRSVDTESDSHIIL